MSQPVKVCLDATRALNLLGRRGLLESDEAELIRDQSDEAWGCLTGAERLAVRLASQEFDPAEEAGAEP